MFALSVSISRECDTAKLCNRFRFNETTQKMLYLIRRSIWHCGRSFYNLPFAFRLAFHQLIARVLFVAQHLVQFSFFSSLFLSFLLFLSEPFLFWLWPLAQTDSFAACILHTIFGAICKKKSLFILSIQCNWPKSDTLRCHAEQWIVFSVPNSWRKSDERRISIQHAFPFPFVRYFTESFHIHIVCDGIAYSVAGTSLQFPFIFVFPSIVVIVMSLFPLKVVDWRKNLVINYLWVMTGAIVTQMSIVLLVRTLRYYYGKNIFITVQFGCIFPMSQLGVIMTLLPHVPLILLIITNNVSLIFLAKIFNLSRIETMRPI